MVRISKKEFYRELYYESGGEEKVTPANQSSVSTSTEPGPLKSKVTAKSQKSGTGSVQPETKENAPSTPGKIPAARKNGKAAESLQSPKQTPLRRSPRLRERESQTEVTVSSTTRGTKPGPEETNKPGKKRYRIISTSPSPEQKSPVQRAPEQPVPSSTQRSPKQPVTSSTARLRTNYASKAATKSVAKQPVPSSRLRTNYASKAATKSVAKDQRLVFQELDPITPPRQKRKSSSSDPNAKTSSESTDLPTQRSPKRLKATASGTARRQKRPTVSPPKRAPTSQPKQPSKETSKEKDSGKPGSGSMDHPQVTKSKAVFQDHVFYFVPKVNMKEKLKSWVEAALVRGATLVTDFEQDHHRVTHVCFLNNFYLKGDGYDLTSILDTVTVVNTDYIFGSIQEGQPFALDICRPYGYDETKPSHEDPTERRPSPAKTGQPSHQTKSKGSQSPKDASEFQLMRQWAKMQDPPWKENRQIPGYKSGLDAQKKWRKDIQKHGARDQRRRNKVLTAEENFNQAEKNLERATNELLNIYQYLTDSEDDNKSTQRESRSENDISTPPESEESPGPGLKGGQDHDSDDEGARTEDEPPAKRTRRSLAQAGKLNQDAFTCMHRHDGQQSGENPNARTIEILQNMGEYYERTNDHWRTIAYRKAVATLKKQPTLIRFAAEAQRLHGIGPRLALKIEEIVRTDTLRRLEATTNDPTDQVLQTFLKIYGVGFRQAHVWIAQGLRTLADLAARASLTANQRVGLEHYDDFAARIPRAEIDAHAALVRDALAEVSPALHATVGGSYRRGAPDSGDVDFLVSGAQLSLGALRQLVLRQLVPLLFERGYLQCGLAVSNADAGSKWHGAAALPEQWPAVWRRVDFLLVPEGEWGAALLYFTGNDLFNRSIRLLARKKGMRLNQHGLWKDVARGPGGKRLTQGTLAEARSEERIFELLGVPWRPPEHRIV